MFRCAKCKSVVGPREASVVVPSATRLKVYPLRSRANFVYKLDPAPAKHRHVDDSGGRGDEWVGERRLCRRCAEAG